MTAETVEFLARNRKAIASAAEAALERSHSRHYEEAGARAVHVRLETLFDHLLESLEARDLGPVLAYAQQVAEERFQSGYDLSEVQTAFNALEEATWGQILAALDPSQLAEALGLVTTILGAGKDALARQYVSLAARAHAPSLDLRRLFAGTEGV